MSKQTIWISAAAGAVVALFLVFYGLSPVFAANALGKALKSGDRDRLEQLVDFPSVREHLKDDLHAKITEKMQAESHDNALAAGFGMLIGPAIVDRAVDTFITPAMIATAIQNGQAHDSAHAASGGADKASWPKAHYAYDGLNRFKITYPSDNGAALALIMTRQGLFGWRVTRLDMAPDGFDGLSNKRASNDADGGFGGATLADDPDPSAPDASATAPPPPPPPPPPVQPVATAPSPADDNPMAAQSLAVARAYMAAWSSPSDPDGDAIRRFYADDVFYYGRRKSVDTVMTEKHAFAERWPARDYTLREPTLTTSCSPDAGCTVTGVVDWRAQNAAAGRQSTGAASFSMIVQDGRITAESGAVLSRNFVKQ